MIDHMQGGFILPSDLVWTQGMLDWALASSVFSDVALPHSRPASMPVFTGLPQMSHSAVPLPPDFHWGFVLLLSIVTRGWFFHIWLLVIFLWMRHLEKTWLPTVMLTVSSIMIFALDFLAPEIEKTEDIALFLVYLGFFIVAIVLNFTCIFMARAILQRYYNTAEPINLHLNPFLTFFLSVYYFQYHLSRIARWKKQRLL